MKWLLCKIAYLRARMSLIGCRVYDGLLYSDLEGIIIEQEVEDD